MIDNIDKVKIKKISISLGIVLFFFLTILLFLILSRNLWDKRLSRTVKAFLDQKTSVNYEIKSGVKISSGFSTSAYGFKVMQNNNEETVVVINITTLYGPYPAVFICHNDGSVQFIGFIGMSEDFEDLAASVSMKSTIYYWQKRLPLILTVKGNSNVK